jgi:hypothetical protein
MDYTEEEAQRRTEAALRAAFNTPPKPQSDEARQAYKAEGQESRQKDGWEEVL